MSETKKKFHLSGIKLLAVLVAAIFVSSAFTFIAASDLGYTTGYNQAYPVAYKAGVTDTLTNVANLLQTKGVTLDWKLGDNGVYTVTVRTVDGSSATLNIALNLNLVHRDKYGNVISNERGAGTFTNNGKNWTMQQILYVSGSIAGFATGGGTAGIPVPGSTTVNNTQAALWLGDATTAASSVTSIVQATETQANGMGRAKESSCYYAAGTGTGTIGQANVTVTKTCTPSGQTSAEWGLYYGVYSASDTSTLNSLIAYDSTPGSKNLAASDTLQETWTFSFS